MKSTLATRRALLLPALLFLGSARARAQVASFSAIENVSVSVAERNEVSRMADAGVVSVEGAGGFVITIAGELRARADRNGVIGVILVPELSFFSNLSRNRRIVLAAAEFTTPLAAGSSSYFISPSKKFPAGFTAYRLFLFNTTGAAATVNVYVNPTRD